MQTRLGNDRCTTMRPVVAKTIPKKQNTIDDGIYEVNIFKI
jgi:hypothetical protein